MHKAKYRATGEVVAVKIQYPNLRVQTKLDLFVIRRLTKMANYLTSRYGYSGIDFDKFLNHFEKGLRQELDFKTEVINSQKTLDNFRFVTNSDDLYIPKVDVLKSTKRTILMEYVEGVKIDDIEGLNKQFGSAKKCTNVLVDIFAKMIFMHGHVHCDAHPGNILVRPNPKNPSRPQIVLLDHGFYGTTS